METNTMSAKQLYLKEYRQNNKDKIKEREKQYREDNKDKIKENKKKFYEKNKEEIKKKQTVKVKCELCGSIVQKRELTNHKKKSKKCQLVQEHIISLSNNETN